jgi:hypothetical protein
VLGKRAAPDFKPWTMFGMWANGGGSVPYFRKQEEEKYETDAMAEDEPAEQLPLEIIKISWQHKDEKRKKESPEAVSNGDSIELSGEFKNYVEGAGVDFFVYGKSGGNEKEVAKIHSRCKSMKSTADWTVDIAKLDEKPDLQFECTARDKQSKRCAIKYNSAGDFITTF